jgi:hypothetical protein
LPSHTTTERSEKKNTHTHTLPQKQHHKYWTQAKLYNLLLSFTLTGELEIGNNKKKEGKQNHSDQETRIGIAEETRRNGAL